MTAATTSIATERDRLFFQQERDRVTAVYELWIEASEQAEALHARLDEFDELDESIIFEETGGGVRHRYSGEPLVWMQQRRGEAWGRLVGTARALLCTARELEGAAPTTSRSGRLARIARGFLALATEAARVAEGFGPGTSGDSQIDWVKVYAIRDGIRRLEDQQDAEFEDEIRHTLRSHEAYRRDMIAMGMGDYIAEKVDGDPGLLRCLAVLREYTERRQLPPDVY